LINQEEVNKEIVVGGREKEEKEYITLIPLFIFKNEV
jgi:hypothetical protein